MLHAAIPLTVVSSVLLVRSSVVVLFLSLFCIAIRQVNGQ